MKRVRLIHFDDWTALYLDGQLLYQNHGIRIEDFMSVLQASGAGLCIEFKSVQADELDEAAVHFRGTSPTDIAGLKRTKT